MTHDEINHAMALHLGVPTTAKRWKFNYSYGGAVGNSTGHHSLKDAEFHAAGMARAYGGPSGQPEEYEEDLTECGAIPNWAGDLNVMADAEKSLTQEQCFAYHECIQERIIPRSEQECFAERWTFHATAAMRAESFLRIMGLWVES